MKRTELRAVPAVEKVVQALGTPGLPRPLVVALVREELASIRREPGVPSFEQVVERASAALDTLRRSRIQPVINGTGVVIHTNLGRAPLSEEAVKAVTLAGGAYNNLEFDLSTGRRGARAAYVERALALLCRSQAATVVNNCAAALVLLLRHFTQERPEVVISRGELIQIGGGFRIPEILEASGAALREVGTTNRTSLQDYARATGRKTGLILKVHRSNFFMDGFVETPPSEEISRMARAKRVPFVEDLGSGALVATEALTGSGPSAGGDSPMALEHEPTPSEALKKGADLVCFSGDKLMGGPQAGIIAGRKRWVNGLKREPFFRALRCDKLVLAGLQATVESYLNGEPVPSVALLGADSAELRRRGEALAARLSGSSIQVSVASGRARVGGGTLPRSELASVTLDLAPGHGGVAKLADRLRRGDPPVVGYVDRGRLRLDLRTVFPSQDGELAEAIAAATA